MLNAAKFLLRFVVFANWLRLIWWMNYAEYKRFEMHLSLLTWWIKIWKAFYNTVLLYCFYIPAGASLSPRPAVKNSSEIPSSKHIQRGIFNKFCPSSLDMCFNFNDSLWTKCGQRLKVTVLYWLRGWIAFSGLGGIN